MPISVALEEINEAVKTINIRHGTNYQLLSRFDKGEWGAYKIAEPGKQPVVLKFFTTLQNTNIVDADPELAKEITKRLLSLGYPVPKYIHTGSFGKKGLYWVQEVLPGKPLWENPTVEQIEQILSLLELQRNQAVSSKQNWSKIIKEAVFGQEPKRVNFLKNHSKETREFLETMIISIKGLENLILPTTDIVHGDFSYHQVMVSNGRIIGIIDWQEAGCGDWLIDLTRLIYSLHDRPHLATPLIKKLKTQELPRIKIYTVFTALEMLSWPIQNYEANIENAFNKAQSAFNFVFVKNCEY